MKKWMRAAAAFMVAAALAACGGGGGGGGGGDERENNAPQALLLASGDVRNESGGLRATLGGTIRLDAGASTDADGDALAYAWTLLRQPAGGTAPAAGAAAVMTWHPDALGDYTYLLKVTDTRAASATRTVVVSVDNRAPAASAAVSVQFTPVPFDAPAQPALVGSSVVIDATASTDPDGDAVSVSFELLARPEGSAAVLTTAGRVARFTADTLGTYRLRVRGVDGGGASFESNYTFQADNRAPNPVVLADARAVVANGGENLVTTSVGYDVLLNGTSSSDPDADAITRTWSLAARPVNSTATLSATNGTAASMSPDVLGDYVVTLTVADPRGASSVHTTTVRVNNRRPVAQVSTNATPQSLPAAPSILVPLGTKLTLRGDGSTDADGDALTHAWTIDSRPAGSSAALSSTSDARPMFVPDREGAYAVRLRVTDPAGAYSERTLTIQVGTHAPVAVVDKGVVTVLQGATVPVSAALSFDQDGDALAYQWSIDARPVGSTATLSGASAAQGSFVPDVSGTYALAVRVSDGKSASFAYVTVRALAAVPSSVSLPFAPLFSHYSKGLDRLVVATGAPDALRVVDPFTGGIASIALPTAVKNFSLSADGKLAVVLHEGSFSLVDLQAHAVLRTAATGGSQSDAFVTNAGMVYAIGTTGGFRSAPIFVFDGRTGAQVPQTGGFLGSLYGIQYGVYASSLGRILLMEQGLSPADIDYVQLNTATSQVTRVGDSPYHGDYAMNVPLYLSSDEGLVFTSSGTYFRTSTLNYAGRLAGVNALTGFSHSAANSEALALVATAGVRPAPGTFPAAYKRFTGELLFPDTDLALPLIGGAQSYGRKIYHSANGSHVVLVQTGSAAMDGTGAAYHVIVR